MLLMVLSILLMSKRSFYGGSFTYLAGKFLTYLLLGFTIGTLFGVIENTLFRTVQKGLELFFAVLAFIFGVTISHTITKESTVIGTLSASGTLPEVESQND